MHFGSTCFLRRGCHWITGSRDATHRKDGGEIATCGGKLTPQDGRLEIWATAVKANAPTAIMAADFILAD